MKKTLALVLTLALAFAAMFTLVSCDCKHPDENNDCICDKCEETLHVDEDSNCVCDKCETALDHVDEDANFVCDVCKLPIEQDIEVDASLNGTYDVTMWVSETDIGTDSVVKMTQRQVEEFQKENPGIKINLTISGVTEADAGSKVVADVATAPDIYCFAQDQLARLVQAGALAKPGVRAQAYINAINDQGAVNAAKVAGTIYAYPMTSDNGYYLYYDKSVVTNPESLEDIIADCEKAGKKFRFALENAWYTASFFFATGCKSNWTMAADGSFTSVDDTFNSPEGLIAMKGMQKLAQSACYDSDADKFDGCAAIVTGVWNSVAAGTHFGDNLAATDLPSFTVDGKEYHLGSYGGNKLMGVKPQSDSNKAAVLQLLAQYLTSQESQMERFEVFGWGPSSILAQNTDAVKANISLSALAKQSAYSIPQGQISGSWWDIAKVLGAEAKAAKSEADLQAALTNYRAAIDALFQMSEEQKRAWSVIGKICGTDWDTDFAMTEDPANTWTSEELTLNVGDELKVRQGASWDLSFGFDAISDSAAEYIEGVSGGNCVVKVAGTYKIQFVYDETAKTGVINLIAAE